MNLSELGELFTGEALRATTPMILLGVAALLLLVVDLFPGSRGARPVAFLAGIGGSAVACASLLVKPLENPSIFQGTFLADASFATWGLIFLLATLLAWAYSVGYYRGENVPFKGDHDLLMLASPIGMMLMVGARDLIVFFLGLELLSIPLYALAAFRRSRTDSVEAGVKYFLLGAFAAGIFLYGSALLYSDAGTLSLDELAARGAGSKLAVAGAALLAASVFFKISVFPFHLWVPDVYQGSPTPVTALMATGTKAAAFGFLLPAAFLLPPQAAGTLAGIALLTMAAGNLGALMQADLKRMLAYSGIAHAGTLLLVVAASITEGGDLAGARTAALFYMGAYVFTASGAFGLIALLEADGEDFTKLENLRGLARSRPGVAAAMTLFMLSLGGIPATGGFLGKWFVFSEVVQADLIAVAVLAVLLSVVALGYYLRVVIALYMQPAPEGRPAPETTRPLSAGLATAVCVAGVIAMGIMPGWFVD